VNRKELQEWLNGFPETTNIDIVFHRQGLNYYEQGGYAYVEPFEPLKDEWNFSINGHFYYDSGNNTLLLGGHNES
jgi:hypothetical protein